MLQRGFTMIELVMVVVLIGVLSALAIPRLGSLSSYSLIRAGQDLVEAIRYTQQLSMTHSGSPNYAIAITGGGYTVFHDLNDNGSFNAGGEEVINPLTGAASYTENSGEWSGITITGGETITFNARGKPTCSSTACSDTTGSNASLSLDSGSDSIAVTVSKYTGYAYVN